MAATGSEQKVDVLPCSSEKPSCGSNVRGAAKDYAKTTPVLPVGSAHGGSGAVSTGAKAGIGLPITSKSAAATPAELAKPKLSLMLPIPSRDDGGSPGVEPSMPILSMPTPSRRGLNSERPADDPASSSEEEDEEEDLEDHLEALALGEEGYVRSMIYEHEPPPPGIRAAWRTTESLAFGYEVVPETPKRSARAPVEAAGGKAQAC
eukprot:TRINITY_DN9781_c0_g2_i1.p1 TRINITY_DN9781_c0_g2~~TRINITY_DN9781_c0_g2_i1.p1  ORF type:complete len:206 (+),score=44.76 TRINITY_DN9781_c0_g2_i1:66-683(+)